LLAGFSSATPLELDNTGALKDINQVVSENGRVILYLPKSTKVVDSLGNIVKSLSYTPVPSPPVAPSLAAIVFVADLGPSGAKFAPPISLAIRFDPKELPNGVKTSDLYLAFWDGTNWKSMPGIVDVGSSTLKANVDHFTQFAVIGSLKPTPSSPVAGELVISKVTVSSAEYRPGETVIIDAAVTNTGNVMSQGDVILNINRVRESSEHVNLAPNETAQIRFTLNKSNPGVYAIDVNGVPGSFIVNELTPTQSAGLAPTSTSTPGKVPAATLLRTNWTILVPVLVIVFVLSVILTRILWKRLFRNG
jgi:hypothetical protein